MTVFDPSYWLLDLSTVTGKKVIYAPFIPIIAGYFGWLRRKEQHRITGKVSVRWLGMGYAETLALLGQGGSVSYVACMETAL